MSTSIPILYVFAISHYCEKARWALNYLGADYKLQFVAPGEHLKIARKFGAKRGSVPYLVVAGRLIQGSSNIVDWAEKASSARGRTLTPIVGHAECSEIEKRIDDVAGVHVRRYYYSEALAEHPETVRPLFISNLPWQNKLLIRIAWKKIQRIMISAMDLGMQQGEESRVILDAELQWLDDMLADGRPYLVGEHFSRADIAVASLLAPLTVPPQHPTYKKMQHPPRIAQQVAGWSMRPSLRWVTSLYEKHR